MKVEVGGEQVVLREKVDTSTGVGKILSHHTSTAKH